MKITSVAVTPVAVPYRPEVGKIVTAGLVLSEARHVLVEVHTDEGIVGLGEAVPRPSVYGETVDSVISALRDLLVPPILGLDPRHVERIWAKWSRVEANTTAKAALDVACHDIAGRSADLPLSAMLGGWTDDRVPLTMPFGIEDDAALLERVSSAVASGFRSIKVKVGTDLVRDQRIVAAIREVMGPEISLYVDANQGYSRAEALSMAKTLEEFGVALFEEPLPGGDVEGRVRIAQATTVPLLIDETIKQPSDALREIQRGTAGAFSIRSPRSGITWSRKLVGIAEIAGVPSLVGSHRELGVMTAASLHLAAGFMSMSYPAELGAYSNLVSGLVKPEIEIAGGAMRLPKGPGLGVDLDETSVAEFRVGDTVRIGA